MRVAMAPDKFKGSLTAVEAAEAISEGLRQSRRGVDLELCQRNASTLLMSLAQRLAQTSPQFRAAEAEGSDDQPAAPTHSTQSR